MIKQNIFIAIIAILCFIGAWSVACAFIKIDVCTTSLINFSSDIPQLTIENKDASYIENHDITYVKVEYEKQFFSCHITFESQNNDYTNYLIFLPEVIPKSIGYLMSNIVIDSLNVYQYILKK